MMSGANKPTVVLLIVFFVATLLMITAEWKVIIYKTSYCFATLKFSSFF